MSYQNQNFSQKKKKILVSDLNPDRESMPVTFFGDKIEIEMTALIRKSDQNKYMDFKSSKYKLLCLD